MGYARRWLLILYRESIQKSKFHQNEHVQIGFPPFRTENPLVFLSFIDKQEIQRRALFEVLLPDENILTPPPGGIALG